VKNNVLSLPDRRIIWLSKTYEGSVHDKKICDNQPLHLVSGINLWQDTGFQGHNSENVNVMMPTKKPKGKELSEDQKRIKSLDILISCTSGTCNWWRKKMSYCQRSFQMSQVWL